MTQPLAALLVVLVLEVKHFVFDYPLQTHYQLKYKEVYGHPGGILHAGLHVLGTGAAFLVITPPLAIGVAILAGEFLVHYHIDWGKGQVVRRSAVTVADNGYWWAIGADQLLHHVTYLVIAAVLVTTAR